MASDIGMRVAASLQPIYDIVLPSTPTVRAAGVAGAADIAPAAGLDLIVVGGLAALVAGALAYIVHRRRKS